MTEDAVWSAFSADPRDPGAAELKATDADRDAAGAALREAYADGRLNRAEYDERSATVLGARTIGEFRPLLVDLVPSGGTPEAHGATADLRGKAVERYRRDLADARNAGVFVSIVTLVIWGVTSLAGGGLYYFWPAWPIAAFALRYVLLRVNPEPRIEQHADRIAEARRVQRQRRRDLGEHDASE